MTTILETNSKIDMTDLVYKKLTHLQTLTKSKTWSYRWRNSLNTCKLYNAKIVTANRLQNYFFVVLFYLINDSLWYLIHTLQG